jgi:hypothetical protein
MYVVAPTLKTNSLVVGIGCHQWSNPREMQMSKLLKMPQYFYFYNRIYLFCNFPIFFYGRFTFLTRSGSIIAYLYRPWRDGSMKYNSAPRIISFSAMGRIKLTVPENMISPRWLLTLSTVLENVWFIREKSVFITFQNRCRTNKFITF